MLYLSFFNEKSFLLSTVEMDILLLGCCTRFSYPYDKITGCLFNCLSVCLFRRISLTAEPIWFSLTGYFSQVPGRFITILGEYHRSPQRNRQIKPNKNAALRTFLQLAINIPNTIQRRKKQRPLGGVAVSTLIKEFKQLANITTTSIHSNYTIFSPPTGGKF